MEHENGNAKNGCPPLRLLEDWITHESSSPQLEAHVGSCPACKNRIESLTDSQFLSEFKQIAQRKWGRRRLFVRERDAEAFPVIDGFTIESRIGVGGMGVVYKARDDKLQRTVAIKVLENLSHATALARFERETKALSRLDHPNVVPVYSSGVTDMGNPYLAMAFVDGISLKQELGERTISPKRAVEIVIQIARGLHEAHQLGLVHRDVKPANILLDAGSGTARLIDFGLVRDRDDETLTREDIICGSPEYMSPEQSLGYEQADARSDIYSLGISLYETLTGTVPFRGRPLNVIDQHRHHDPTPLRQLNPSVPADLENICLKALDKDPTKRYPSANRLADDLQRFLDNRPVAARPISVIQKSKRWAERNPKLATISCLFVAVLFLATGLVTWQWLVARHHRAKAENNFIQAQRNFDFATDQVLNKTKFAARLRKTPGHEIAARDLYRQLVDEIDQLSRLRRQDANIQSIRPILYQSLASQECQVGNATDSLDLFRRSIELTEGIEPQAIVDSEQGKLFSAENAGPTPTQQRNLNIAITRFLLGEALLQTGRVEEALGELQRAQTTFETTLLTTNADYQDWIRRVFVLSLVTESQAWLTVGNSGKAEECLEEAFANAPTQVVRPAYGLTRLEEEFWGKPGTNDLGKIDADFISAYLAHHFGKFHIDESAPDTVRFWLGFQSLQDALKTRRLIGRTVPVYPFWKQNVAMTLMELAKAHSRLGEQENAASLIEESVRVLETLASGSNNLFVHHQLAKARLVRGRIMVEPALVKRDAEVAARLCAEVLSISPDWHDCQDTFLEALEILAMIER